MAIVSVRDFLEGRGHTVGWDNDTKQISVDGNQIDKSAFTLQGQRHYGTPTDILNAIGQGGYQPTQSTVPKLNDYASIAPVPTNVTKATNPTSVADIMNQISSAPAYQSPYAGKIEGLIGQLGQQFQYDPKSDLNLQGAQKQVMESMNERGILNSTMTSEEALKLVPQFQQQAYNQFANQQQNVLRQAEFYNMLDQQGYQKYQDEVDSLYRRADFINALDEQSYQRYRDQVAEDYTDRMYLYNQKLNEASTQQQQVTDAWNRVKELGYVDNQTSLILGLPVGTPSKEVREDIIMRERELQDYILELQSQSERDDKLFQQELELIAERERSGIRQTQVQGQKEIDVFQQKQAIEAQSQQRINYLFQTMMSSGNPSEWLNQNAGALTIDEYTSLKGQVDKNTPTKSAFSAKDYVSRAKEILNSETPLEKADGMESTQLTNKDKAIKLLQEAPIGVNELDEALNYLEITAEDVTNYLRKTGKVSFTGGR